MKKEMKLGLTLCSIIIILFALFINKVSAAPPENSTKGLMSEFLFHINALRTYFVDENKFLAKENEKVISAHLKELQKLTHQAAHDKTLNQDNFKISRKILTNHISETERVFAKGNKAYARWMLSSTQAVCISCHAQMPSSSREIKKFELSNNFTNKLEEAEYLFATRAFEKASSLYDNIIRDYPKGEIKPSQLENAIRRQVAYYSRIKRDPKAAQKILVAYEKNKAIPEFIKRDIQPWIQQFQDWNKFASADISIISEEEVLKLAAANLPASEPSSTATEGGIREVVLLKVSGLLYEYMQTHPQSKITPDLLYYLSAYDRLLNNDFFFALAPLYLRECMEAYPASPIAIKCYEEYEEETVLSYTGSSGTNIPIDVSKDLSFLKKWVESKGKMSIRKDLN